MVRMIMEVRPDPRLFDESSLLECKPMRGRSGTVRSGRAGRSKPSRVTRSPSQQFTSRIYWRDITRAEIRQQQGSEGLREAVTLASTVTPINERTYPHPSSHVETQLEEKPDAASEVEVREPMCLLNAYVNRALESHAQNKIDQRIASEWEVVEDVDAEEYVVL
ncbi:hypothetical protein Agub_g6738 [Astrephomene gubernaculifera]|uniref:Uncharacterized protein n=1 Tax=Astrephomene gubernaculifera TaxID=47775 RepID=A0AAD3HLQ6_9CHLO|nr:hypothetical protein Agub_g6738 [Astrephomene gubernaculifera]